MNKIRLLSLMLVAVICLSIMPPIAYADSQQEPVAVTLSMYSNLSEKNSISGLYRDNVFYITVDDLCQISGAELIASDNKNITLSLSRGWRHLEVSIDGGDVMKEVMHSDSYYITMPVIVKDETVYLSAIDFLHYIGATYNLNKDAKVQFKVAVGYNIFDAIGDVADKGHFFWWDEIDFGKKSVEDVLLNAGVVALIKQRFKYF